MFVRATLGPLCAAFVFASSASAQTTDVGDLIEACMTRTMMLSGILPATKTREAQSSLCYATVEDHIKRHCPGRVAVFDAVPTATDRLLRLLRHWSSVEQMLADMLPQCTPPPADDSGCLGYEEPVTLRGIVGHVVFPAQPNYESVAGGDAAETASFLFLDVPVCVSGGQDEPVASIAAIQLASCRSERPTPPGEYASFTGKLFHSHTGHHHAPALLRCE
jgi:hypothetical protein